MNISLIIAEFLQISSFCYIFYKLIDRGSSGWFWITEISFFSIFIIFMIWQIFLQIRLFTISVGSPKSEVFISDSLILSQNLKVYCSKCKHEAEGYVVHNPLLGICVGRRNFHVFSGLILISCFSIIFLLLGVGGFLLHFVSQGFLGAEGFSASEITALVFWGLGVFSSWTLVVLTPEGMSALIFYISPFLLFPAAGGMLIAWGELRMVWCEWILLNFIFWLLPIYFLEFFENFQSDKVDLITGLQGKELTENFESDSWERSWWGYDEESRDLLDLENGRSSL